MGERDRPVQEEALQAATSIKRSNLLNICLLGPTEIGYYFHELRAEAKRKAQEPILESSPKST